MPNIPTLSEYMGSLSRLTPPIDPTLDSPFAGEIQAAAASLAGMEEITAPALISWVTEHPNWVYSLGLAVGMSQEKLKNTLRQKFGTAGWITLARTQPTELISMLVDDFALLGALEAQRNRQYGFGDVLVARAGTRLTAIAGATAGRKLEDAIEAAARELGLPYETRTRFVGRSNRTAPCDLVIPNGKDAVIAVAAKGFDSTGSRLSDAVREINEMVDVRQSRQYIMAVVDGIGWHGRINDLRRFHRLWQGQEINGMYTLASLHVFRSDLRQAARVHGF